MVEEGGHGHACGCGAPAVWFSIRAYAYVCAACLEKAGDRPLVLTPESLDICLAAASREKT